MNKNYILTLFVLFLFANINAQTFPIGNASFSFNDPARANRAVTGTVYYPATTTGTNTTVANGQFPIVVFGHGFLIPTSEYSAWWNGLVPEGYILVFPDTEGGLTPSHGDFGEDISFLVNTYLSMNAASGSNFFGKLNAKVGIMGHSMGGGSSFLAAASNPNVTTHVSLAAAETNPSAIAAAGSITAPALVLAGSLDCVSPPPANQLSMYNALSSTYKTYVEITDGSHCQFSDATPFAACDIGELTCSGTFVSINSQHAQMLNATLPWFDYWLQCDCDAWSIFQNYLTTSILHTYQDAGTQPSADCCFSNLTQGNSLPAIEIGVADYESIDWIKSNAIIKSGAQVDYDATTYVQLDPGFCVELNAIFNAFIDGCNGGAGGVNLTSSSMDK